MLAPLDRETYAWQLDLPHFDEAAQEKLRSTTALVSRIGGLGGPLAFQLAAAGVGKLLLAHAGPLRKDDMNRQILMRWEDLGTPRVQSAAKTLAAFNPNVKVETADANFSEDNAAELVERADIVFSCAPLFEERFLMNRECVRQNKPLVDAAMYAMEGHVLSVVPKKTPCLACLYPEKPPYWRRRFPVLGVVSSRLANLAALEGIKRITGLPESDAGKLLHFDAARTNLRKITVNRNEDCPVCAKA